MPKRFTDTDIWKSQRWFRKLAPLDKLAFCYIKDQCNHAGIWKIDCSDLMEDLGLEEFNIQKFISSVNTEFDKISGKKIEKERLLILNQNSLWITGFIQFQYENKEGKVSPEAAPVKTAMQILQGLGCLMEGLSKGYFILIEGSARAKDKDKEKDKVKESKIKKVPKIELPVFNTMPAAADFNGLPQSKEDAAIELVYHTQRVRVEKEVVLVMWDVFKKQNLNGTEYYANEGKVYTHFINWIKTQKFHNNVTGKQTVAERQQTGFDALLAKGKQQFNAAREKNNQP